MENQNFKFEILTGSSIGSQIQEVANFRIKYFKDFPYLYVGNEDYEKHYLSGFCEDERSILVRMVDSNSNLRAVSTALPLITCSDILDGAPAMFSKAGFNPERIYYYGEVILDYQCRGMGLVRKIYEIQDEFAFSNGFTDVAIATVVRDLDDPRTPPNYRPSDEVWTKLGFNKTGIKFQYSWPTITNTQEVIEMMNPMIYWTRRL